MHFEYSAEHRDLQSAIRTFLDRAAPLATIPLIVQSDPGEDASVWAAAVQQLGLPGLEVPEELGGSGADAASVAIAMIELGAAMIPGPLAPCIGLAVPLLNALPEGETRATLLAGIAEGTVVPAVDLALFTAPLLAPAHQVAGGSSGAGLTGAVARVIGGASATDLIVLTRIGNEPAVVHVRRDYATTTALNTLDPARREFSLNCTDTPVSVLARGNAALDSLEVAHRRALLFAACEAVGGAERSLEIAVQYAKDRRAFGKVIGSFQALKHRMAAQYVENELARTMLMYASWSTTVPAGESDPTALEQAKVAACEAYLEAARVSIGILGGIGHTWEHPLHLYLKRATVVREQFARPAELRAVIAAAEITSHSAATGLALATSAATTGGHA